MLEKALSDMSSDKSAFQFRRNAMKVARYEVPGNDAKRIPVPPGTIEGLRFVLEEIPRAQTSVDRPCRDGTSLKTFEPSTSYWATFTRSLRDDRKAPLCVFARDLASANNRRLFRQERNESSPARSAGK
jgi:hypothetical protein